MLDQSFSQEISVSETSNAAENVLYDVMAKADDEFSFNHPLGDDHHVYFVEPETNLFDDRKSVLLVRFVEPTDDANYLEDVCPTSCEMRERHGWSQMTMIAHKRTWFRAPEVYDFFDKLDVLGFFDDFDQVIFTGSQACAHAASVFSVAAPGSTVLLFSPVATADPKQADWDPRLSAEIHADDSPRYRNPVKLLDAAKEVFVFFDPREKLDAQHAAMFEQKFVTKIRCRLMGKDVSYGLSQTDSFIRVVEAAGQDTLTAKSFARIYRNRRRDRSYLRRLISATRDRSTPVITGVAARAALTKFDARYFRNALNTAETELTKLGQSLPNVATRKETVSENVAA